MARLDLHTAAAILGLALAPVACGTEATIGGDGGAGTSGDTSTVTSATQGATTHAATSGHATVTAGGGGAVACDPPAEPGSLYENEGLELDTFASTSMCKWRGEVLLIVNIAAQCGYTPEMAGLEDVEEHFGSGSFKVLGFYSNDFGNQGGTDGQITACNSQYGVTFPEFAVDKVTTDEAQPVFKWLLSQTNPGPAPTIEPTWNFHKYLISKTGQLVGHWDSPAYPGDDPANPNDSFETSDIVLAIEAEIAK